MFIFSTENLALLEKWRSLDTWAGDDMAVATADARKLILTLELSLVWAPSTSAESEVFRLSTA